MLLHPLKDPVPPPLAARSRAIFSMLAEVFHAEAPDLACRNLVGVLLAARPRVGSVVPGRKDKRSSLVFAGERHGHIR